jgi:hypothetical protein
MLLAIGAFLALCVASSYLTTTPEQRAEAQARFNRKWNPILIPLNVVLWAFLLMIFFGPKAH